MTLLKDIVKIEKGRKYNLLEENQEGATRVFQANDFRNENKPLYTFDKDGVLAQEDDIMLVWDGSVGQMGFGRSGYVGSTMVKLKVKNKKQFSPFFIYRFLQTKSEYLKRKATGATIMHISRKSLEQLEIPDLDIADQLHIANLLSKAENLISQRKESIRLLDEFLKSTFLEMFYDNPETDNWEEVKFEELAEKKKASMRSGPFGSSLLHGEFTVTGDVKVLGIDNVVTNRFTWKRSRCITNEKFKELKRYQVFPNDVLISIMATLGRTAVVPNDIPLCINSKHLAAITLEKEITNPYFVAYAFHSHPLIVRQMSNNVKGAIMDGLNLTIIRRIKLKLPPVELQNKFGVLFEKTETLKTQYQQSLQELENLYGSLSQKAFRGELSIKDESLLMAAEPKSSYVTQSNIPDNKRGFAKQVLGGKIVSLFKDDNNFTHIKFQKLQYLAEQIAEENLLWNYYRQAAGPHDNKFKYSVIAKLNENKWFEERNYMFYPLQKANDVDRYYKNYFGNKSDRLNELFLLLKNATEKFCEAIATIYAVWNNQIILQLPYNKSEIKKAFFEWSNRKEIIFTEDEFEKALEWMKKHNIKPIGFGQLIKERTGKK